MNPKYNILQFGRVPKLRKGSGYPLQSFVAFRPRSRRQQKDFHCYPSRNRQNIKNLTSRPILLHLLPVAGIGCNRR